MYYIIFKRGNIMKNISCMSKEYKMKMKLGWILFSVMTVVVIILSSILITYIAIWKSGEDLLNIDTNAVESAYLYHNDLSNIDTQRQELELDSQQIEYILTEFSKTRFKKTSMQYDGGYSGIIFKMKDGSEKSFEVRGDCIEINGNQYKCYSYLTNYIAKICT